MPNIHSLSAIGLCLMIATAIQPAQAADKDKKKKDDKKKKEVAAPDTLISPIPMNRQMFAGKVTQAIRGIDAKDGAIDKVVYMEDPVKSKVLSQTFLEDAPLLLVKIENSTATHANKIRYERALADRLNGFRTYTGGDPDVIYYKRLMKNFEDLMNAEIGGKAMEFVRANPNIYTLENLDLIENNTEAKAFLYEKIGVEQPEMMIKRLGEFSRESYADPVIAAAAKVAPSTIMSYAAPTSKYTNVIRRNKDQLVQTIVKIVDQSKKPFKVLPFLNQINDGSKTIAQIDQIAQNDDAYFKSLVELKTSGKAWSDVAINEEIAYRALKYVRTVNELHEKPDAVRFKSIEGFDPSEYYFMLLGGQTNEIYTSSYLGIFKRMMAKMNGKSGYELLEKVRMSNFRTFIRMAAGYNTLSTFLTSMTEEQKTTLMRSFVANLENGGRKELADAVDVADAFGSLNNPELITFLKDEVKSNYERVYKDKSIPRDNREKGVIVYGLLGTIFNNASDATQLQQSVSEIPPINFVDYNALVDKEGKVIQQVFFYGDEDGKISYGSFLTNFRNKNWKIDESNPDWITITSLVGKPTVIYANRPLPEPKDEEAQNKLYEYLDANEIFPTVVIHRGHSYHLEGSLKNLTPKVKIVMLGSCGGFHNLANVLDKAPDANIISTKQVGSYRINEPIIRELNAPILKGENVDWLAMWKNLGTEFSAKSAGDKDLFSDYIPPNRNLGAIFIKAYRKIELSQES